MDTTTYTPGTTTHPHFTSGWISPSGKFIYVGPLPIHFIVEEQLGGDLLPSGWVQFSTHPDHRRCPIHHESPITQQQLDTLNTILKSAPTERQGWLERHIQFEAF